MTLTPPASFTNWRFGEEGAPMTIYGDPPITYNPSTHHIAVSPASGVSSGVVNLLDQTLGAGHKTFTSTPRCAIAPTISSDLANKGYVDSLAVGLSWQQEIKKFYDFTAGAPVGLAVNDRYIAIATFGSFTINYIYTYNGSAYVESIPLEGWACYVYDDTSPSFANQCIIYNGAAWVGMGSSLNHSGLIGLANDDHTQYVKVSGRLGDAVSIPNATASTSTITGALTVAGGVGIVGKAYIGGALNITDATASTTTATGSGIFGGGIGVAGAVNAGGVVNCASTSATVPAVYATCSSATGGNVARFWQGSLANGQDTGIEIGVNETNATNSGYFKYHLTTPNSQTNYLCFGLYGMGDALIIYGSSQVKVGGTDDSTTPATGNLLAIGGVGIGKRLCIGTETRWFDITAPKTAYTRQWHDGTTTYVDCTAASRIYQYQTNFATVKVAATTAASSTITGALVIAGGAGIAGNLYVGGTIYGNVSGTITTGSLALSDTTDSTTPTTGTLTVAGGAGIGKNLCVGAESRWFDITAPKTAYTRQWHDGTTTHVDRSASGGTFLFDSNFSNVSVAGELDAVSEIASTSILVGDAGFASLVMKMPYDTSINASVGSPTAGTAVGTAAISGQWLDLRSPAATSYVWYASGNAIAGVGTLRMKVSFAFIGLPPNHEILFMSDTAAMMYLDFYGTGTLQFGLLDGAGGAIYINKFDWYVNNGQTYDIEVDFQSGGGTSTMYIDGVAVATSVQTTSRASTAAKYYIGTSSSSPTSAQYYPNFRIARIGLYNTMLHTSNFTPPSWSVITPMTTVGDSITYGRTTSTTMTCSTAPVATTDVVRLTDIAAFLTSSNFQMTLISGNWAGYTRTIAHTVYYMRVGAFVMLGNTYDAATTASGACSGSTPFSYSAALPTAIRPGQKLYFSTSIWLTDTGSSVSSAKTASIATNGTLTIEDTSLDGKTMAINPWCFSYICGASS